MRQFFVDDTGELSCMRLMCFLAFSAILGMWMWGCFMAGGYIPMGYGEVGVLTSAMLGKAAQSRFEYGLPGPGGAP